MLNHSAIVHVSICGRVYWMKPPNGLPFSCRERTADTCQKANDLAREAVGCNAVLLECPCSQGSGALNGGRGACYPSPRCEMGALRGQGTQRVPGASRRGLSGSQTWRVI
jgi:hypothetical protein